MKAKTVVYALLENTAGSIISLKNENILRSGIFRGAGGRKACGTGADYHDIKRCILIDIVKRILLKGKRSRFS
jgi:hypothetical protein